MPARLGHGAMCSRANAAGNMKRRLPKATATPRFPMLVAALVAVALQVSPASASVARRQPALRGDLQPEIVAINVHSQYTDELADAIQELRNMRGVLPIRVHDPDSRPPPAVSHHVSTAGAEEGASESWFSGWTAHHVGGTLVFLAFFALLCTIIPIVIAQRKQWEETVKCSGESFAAFLNYRFMDWFTSNTYAPSLVLVFLTLSLIVCGAVLYAILVGGSPSKALWRIFVWSTASPAEGETSGGGRFLGTIVTVCGLIILSLLLGIVSEVFSTKMNEIKSGVSRVVEGDHTLILGFTECTCSLLEELGKARISDGGNGVFVVLSREPKDEVEQYVSNDALKLRGSRVIVRSGNPVSTRDLVKVSAASARQVVILADTAVDPEEADARSIRTLVSLKARRWPTNGRIVVQCCNEANRDLFEQLYDPEIVEVVIVGNIVAKLMAQSAFQPGLARVFGMMLGFDGDEFYSAEWPELTGCSFRDVTFRFEAAVAMGVLTAKGECIINPGWDYYIAPGDKVIVLAEDNDTYSPAARPWLLDDHFELASARTVTCFGLQADGPQKVLVIGWNAKVEPLLLSLNSMMIEGSVVEFYSSVEVEQREEQLEKMEHPHEHITFKHIYVEDTKLTARSELARLEHLHYDRIFVLADSRRGKGGADECSLACVTQLKAISGEEKAHDLCPVVETCEDMTAEQLVACGFTNFVHSNSLVSKALAAVVEDPAVNMIYADFMSSLRNSFEFRRITEFLARGQTVPEELSFWEIAYMSACVGPVILVGWTVPSKNGKKEFQLNPKDKRTPRKWTPEDRLVVIRKVAD